MLFHRAPVAEGALPVAAAAPARLVGGRRRPWDRVAPRGSGTEFE
ncbi:hypothetical protein ACFY04_07095 [Streptomyces sp. NPDC001549]